MAQKKKKKTLLLFTHFIFTVSLKSSTLCKASLKHAAHYKMTEIYIYIPLNFNTFSYTDIHIQTFPTKFSMLPTSALVLNDQCLSSDGVKQSVLEVLETISSHLISDSNLNFCRTPRETDHRNCCLSICERTLLGGAALFFNGWRCWLHLAGQTSQCECPQHQ